MSWYVNLRNYPNHIECHSSMRRFLSLFHWKESLVLAHQKWTIQMRTDIRSSLHCGLSTVSQHKKVKILTLDKSKRWFCPNKFRIFVLFVIRFRAQHLRTAHCYLASSVYCLPTVLRPLGLVTLSHHNSKPKVTEVLSDICFAWPSAELPQVDSTDRCTNSIDKMTSSRALELVYSFESQLD